MGRHWSAALDRWLTTQPEGQDLPFPGDPFYPTCWCGSWLKREPERTEGKVMVASCDGQSGLPDYETQCGQLRAHEPHEFPVHAWEEEYRTCKRCGTIHVMVLA